MTELYQGSTSIVLTIPSRGIAIKCVEKVYDEQWGLLDREYLFLEKMVSDRFPKPKYKGNGVLITNYLGEQLTPENAPPDTEYQIEEIILHLDDRGICHNDIKPDNFLVMDGKISLIDFGWATNKGYEIPLDWPNVLGGEYKADNGFNDRESAHKVIRSIKGQ